MNSVWKSFLLGLCASDRKPIHTSRERVYIFVGVCYACSFLGKWKERSRLYKQNDMDCCSYLNDCNSISILQTLINILRDMRWLVTCALFLSLLLPFILTRISGYLFSLFIIAPGIPVYCISTRYNLYVGEVCGRKMSFFFGVIAPWLVGFIFCQGPRFADFLNWTALYLRRCKFCGSFSPLSQSI